MSSRRVSEQASWPCPRTASLARQSVHSARSAPVVVEVGAALLGRRHRDGLAAHGHLVLVQHLVSLRGTQMFEGGGLKLARDEQVAEGGRLTTT